MSNETLMQVINRGDREVVFVQGSDAPNSIMAIADAAGWITIGHIGDDHLILDDADWSKFVKFVNEIAAYLDEHGLPFSKSEQTLEKCNESL